MTITTILTIILGLISIIFSFVLGRKSVSKAGKKVKKIKKNKKAKKAKKTNKVKKERKPRAKKIEQVTQDNTQIPTTVTVKA